MTLHIGTRRGFFTTTTTFIITCILLLGAAKALTVDDVSLCDASRAPKNGGVGNCSSFLPIGQTCKPTCNEGFMLAKGGRQSYCASGGKLSYEAKCVVDGCFVIKKHAAQVRNPKPMNEIIVNPDGKRDKTILVSKDDREMHVDVNF